MPKCRDLRAFLGVKSGLLILVRVKDLTFSKTVFIVSIVFSHLELSVIVLSVAKVCPSHLGQMSAPPHFGFGLGPPDPGALDPGNVALH